MTYTPPQQHPAHPATAASGPSNASELSPDSTAGQLQRTGIGGTVGKTFRAALLATSSVIALPAYSQPPSSSPGGSAGGVPTSGAQSSPQVQLPESARTIRNIIDEFQRSAKNPTATNPEYLARAAAAVERFSQQLAQMREEASETLKTTSDEGMKVAARQRILQIDKAFKEDLVRDARKLTGGAKINPDSFGANYNHLLTPLQPVAVPAPQLPSRLTASAPWAGRPAATADTSAIDSWITRLSAERDSYGPSQDSANPNYSAQKSWSDLISHLEDLKSRLLQVREQKMELIDRPQNTPEERSGFEQQVHKLDVVLQKILPAELNQSLTKPGTQSLRHPSDIRHFSPSMALREAVQGVLSASDINGATIQAGKSLELGVLPEQIVKIKDETGKEDIACIYMKSNGGVEINKRAGNDQLPDFKITYDTRGKARILIQAPDHSQSTKPYWLFIQDAPNFFSLNMEGRGSYYYQQFTVQGAPAGANALTKKGISAAERERFDVMAGVNSRATPEQKLLFLQQVGFTTSTSEPTSAFQKLSIDGKHLLILRPSNPQAPLSEAPLPPSAPKALPDQAEEERLRVSALFALLPTPEAKRQWLFDQAFTKRENFFERPSADPAQRLVVDPDTGAVVLKLALTLEINSEAAKEKLQLETVLSNLNRQQRQTELTNRDYTPDPVTGVFSKIFSDGSSLKVPMIGRPQIPFEVIDQATKSSQDAVKQVQEINKTLDISPLESTKESFLVGKLGFKKTEDGAFQAPSSDKDFIIRVERKDWKAKLLPITPNVGGR